MRVASTTVPPRISAPRWRRFGAVGAAGLALGALVFFFNPATHGFYPACIFHSLTGWNCPGCGATRALHALLHGNVRLALRDNALFVALLAGLALYSLQFAGRRQKSSGGRRWAHCLWALLGASILFAVFRNLPGYEWLSP